MKARRQSVGLSLLAGLAVSAAMLLSCANWQGTLVAPPVIEGATFAGNQSCAECHANITRRFPGSPHARVHFEGAKLAGQTGCESCHGAGSKHIQAGGGRGKFIVNPGRNAEACFNCHLATHAEFNLPQHHPVLEGKMNCVQCHDPHGLDIMKPAGRGLQMARLNENCATCHRAQSRPFVFEHEALREGCTTCHNPHGSMNAKLLVERDNNLCLKCHAQVQGAGTGGTIFIGQIEHTAFIRLGTCWSAGCHSSVHGSQVHPRMLY